MSTLLSSSCFSAVTASLDFESETLNDFFSDSVTDWSQDQTNPSAFGSEIPLAYIATTDFGFGSSNTGHLGTQFGNLSPNASTTVTGAFNFVGVGTAPNPQVTLNLAIIDPGSASFPGRDAFSVAVTDGVSATIAQIDFTPDALDDTSWDVALGVNGAPVSSSSASVTVGSAYEFVIEFGATSTNFLYGSAVGGATVGIGARGPALGSQMAEIEMTHNPLAAEGTSANTFVFDNIFASVPEPSSCALLLLCLPLFAARRRS
ncbi:hypothetical protein OAK94_01545 [bacterium]|nr:hypothetical protein [bacterium]MDC0270369.1 hypothetical protein [bacterium]